MSNWYENKTQNWFSHQRQQWIGEMLRIYGFINRHHIMSMFGVSEPQASMDLSLYRDRNPGHMHYDVKLKTYVSDIHEGRLRVMALPSNHGKR